MPCKETPVLVLRKAPLLVLRQSRQLLEDHLVPGREVEAKIIVASKILALLTLTKFWLQELLFQISGHGKSQDSILSNGSPFEY